MPGMTWRKSSRSYSEANCIEVAWRKSSWSAYNGDCVEVAWRMSSRCQQRECVKTARAPGAVLVRDSKHPGGPVLPVGAIAWREFTASLKTGTPQPLA